MSLTDDSGWAIRRNGTCLTGSRGNERDCGATRAPFHACCPSSTDCPTQYNVACCQSGTNCTSALVDTPRCANASWVMFDNGGQFCCEQNQVGYNLGGTNGCSQSGRSIPDGAQPLAAISQSPRPSPTTSSTSTPLSTTSIISTTPSPTPETSNTSIAGPVAGGVVGGIALIAIIAAAIIFIRRKRSRDQSATTYSGLPNVSEKDGTTTAPDRVEIDGNPRVELPPSEAPAKQPVYELQS